MNDNPLEQQLSAYRDATERAVPGPSLTDQILNTIPGRARARRFVRDARAGLLVAAILAVGTEAWAALETTQLKRQLLGQLDAFAGGP